MASAFHHVGLQVGSLESGADFYIESFDGRWLTLPILIDGPTAAAVMGGPPGTAFRSCKVGFAEGAVELFEFVGPERPAWATEGKFARVPHFAIVVDDVEATLKRVREAGGTELWPEIVVWGDSKNMYVADLDGNVIEVKDASLEDVVATTYRMFPETNPGSS